VKVELLIPTTKAYSTIDNEEFGYLRPVKDGDCIIKRQTKTNPSGSRFVIHGSKDITQTVKWGLDLESLLSQDIKIDPWWNASFGYKYQITSNSTIEDVLSINNTWGITYNYTVWSYIGGTNNYLYCQNAGCLSGLVAIANNTNEKFWENDTTLTGNSPSSMWDRIIAVWHMNNQSGSINDSSGNNHKGQMKNFPVQPTINATFGQGIDFAGTNDFINFTNMWTDMNVSAFTIEFWFKPDVVSDNDGIFCVGTMTGACTISIYIAGSQLDTQFRANGRIGDIGYTPPATTVWTHLVWTYNSSVAINSSNLYYNAVRRMTKTENENSPYTITLTGRNTNIGTYYDGNYYYDGKLDEFRIYNRSLTYEEIQRHYWDGINNMTRLGAQEISTDTIKPTYSLNSTNSTLAGTPIKHSLNWTDDTGLSGYIFSYNNGTVDWQNVTNVTQPPPGRWSGLFVCNNQQLCVLSMGRGCMLNGGTTCGNPNGANEIAMNDTWLYFANNNTWLNITDISSWVSSSSKQWIYGVFIPTNNSAMFYGGLPGSGSIWNNDTYYFHFDTLKWENVTNGTNHPGDYGRDAYHIAYDKSRNQAVLFAGSDSSVGKNDTWIFFASNRTWQNMNANITKSSGTCTYLPQQNYGGMSYDEVNDVMIVPHLLSPCGSQFLIYNITNNSWEAKPNGKGYYEQAGVGGFPPTNINLIAGGDYGVISRNWTYSILSNFTVTNVIYGKVQKSHGGMMAYDLINNASYFFSGCQVNQTGGTCSNVTQDLFKYSSWFVNDSWTSMTGTGNWSNVTKTSPSTVGTIIKWCVYSNDTSNNWNGTSCVNPFSYITTSAVGDSCTPPSNAEWVITDVCNKTTSVNNCPYGTNITSSGSLNISGTGLVFNTSYIYWSPISTGYSYRLNWEQGARVFWKGCV
jgi:hypothetical protein